jgi:predicted acylesterase/phospholipase RssA
MNLDDVRFRIRTTDGWCLSTAGASAERPLTFVRPNASSIDELFWLTTRRGTDGIVRGTMLRNFSKVGGHPEFSVPDRKLLTMRAEDTGVQATALIRAFSKQGADATSHAPSDGNRPRWITRTLSSRRRDTLYAEYDSFVAVSPQGLDPTLRVAQQRVFVCRTTDTSTSVRRGQLRVALNFRNSRDSSDLWLVRDPSGSAQLQSAATGSEPPAAAWMIFDLTTPLRLHFSEARRDHYAAATPESLAECAFRGYRALGDLGTVFMSRALPDLIPLELFWHDQRQDTALASSFDGRRRLFEAGYVWVRTEGYVLRHEASKVVPLRSYENDSLSDVLTAPAGSAKEREAYAAGYRFRGEEGFIWPLLVAAPPTVSPPQPIHPASTVPVVPGVTLPPAANEPAGVSLIGSAAPQVVINLQRGLRHKTALVLSGGGAKGAFEVGAVKRLWQTVFRDRRPDIITGVSVGALNAAKLGEGRAESADELEAIWRDLGRRGNEGTRVYEEIAAIAGDLSLEFLKEQGDDLVNPEGISVGVSRVFKRFTTFMSMLQSVHSMLPLRTLIDRLLNVDALMRSGIQLRLGLTDVKSGQLITVTQPFHSKGRYAGYALLEPEGDNAVGANWLNRPIYGAARYAMHFADAVYASAVMPVFMDPVVLNLMVGHELQVMDGANVCMLPRTYTPFTNGLLQQALARRRAAVGAWQPLGSLEGVYQELRTGTTRNGNPFDQAYVRSVNYSDDRGYFSSGHRMLFDGGLRDTMAIRAAMRLGAREVYLVGGDRLGTFNVNFSEPALATQLPDYLFSLLGIWNNDVARNDVMQAISVNEFLGWLYRSAGAMPAAERDSLVAAFNDYWRRTGPVLRANLGAATFAGGEHGFTAAPGSADGTQLGRPFFDEGCKVHMVCPPRDVLSSLEMHDRIGIADAIDLGYEVAGSPVEISAPVTDALVRG